MGTAVEKKKSMKVGTVLSHWLEWYNDWYWLGLSSQLSLLSLTATTRRPCPADTPSTFYETRNKGRVVDDWGLLLCDSDSYNSFWGVAYCWCSPGVCFASGLYTVEKFWFTKGLSGYKVYKFALQRCKDQPPPPWELASVSRACFLCLVSEGSVWT